MVAVIVSGVASSSGRAHERALRGGSFTSTIDASFSVVARRGARGSQTWSLSSSGAPLDAEGIPPAGVIGITLAESAPPTTSGHGGEASSRARGGAQGGARGGEAQGGARGGEAQAERQANAKTARELARAEAAIALMSTIVRTPSGAEGVETSEPPRFRTLAGASAAEESYEYLYGGHGNVQVDVVARRGGEVYFIELDTELARVAQGEAALTRLLRDWHWT